MTEVFKVKDFEMITSSLLNYIYYSDNKLTDFNVGSVLRSLLEAVASEHEETYYRIWEGLQEAIKVSILETFGFFPEEATVAKGTVIFGRETPAPSDIEIPAGTVLYSPTNIAYRTLNIVVLRKNTTSVYCNVESLEKGSKANLYGTDVTLRLKNPIYGISWCKTATQISGGKDKEAYVSVFNRFAKYIQTLSRGTKSALEYGATQVELKDENGNITEQVLYAKAYEYLDNRGRVEVFIDNGKGTTSQTLVDATQQFIEGYYDASGTIVGGYKSAGVVVTVLPAQAVNTDVYVKIKSRSFSTVKSFVERAITEYFDSLDIADKLILDKLKANIYNCHELVQSVIVVTPTADVNCNYNQRVILRNLTVEEFE